MPVHAPDDRTPASPEAGRSRVAPDVRGIGRVRLAPEAGVRFGAVPRGDGEPIGVGERGDIQGGRRRTPTPGSRTPSART